MITFKQYMTEGKGRVALSSQERESLSIIYHISGQVSRGKSHSIIVLLNTDEDTARDRPVWASLEKKGLIEIDGLKIKLTKRGMMVGDNLSDIHDRASKVKQIPLKKIFKPKD